ncbi:unnamed protein product, partial [Adineta steineri]
SYPLHEEPLLLQKKLYKG